MENHLHIITLNIPYPPDYGGMIDTFYRIKALHNAGIKLHLHCFEYDRQRQIALEPYCNSVSYYKRKMEFTMQLSLLPYTVITRNSKELIMNLSKDDYPVLFDGLHTTFCSNNHALTGKRKFVRTHNIEHSYYRSLAKNEKNLLNKVYFSVESVRLKNYERILAGMNCIFAISKHDNEYFNSKYNNSNLLLPFVPFEKVLCKKGCGDYILFHGNLSVNENIVAAEMLMRDVFPNVKCECIIAGKNPSPRLRSEADRLKNLTLVADPDDKLMLDLIQNAHVNVLPAVTENGFKLKLLSALFAGRYCVVNHKMAEGTQLDSICYVAEGGASMADKIRNLMGRPFTSEMISERSVILLEKYSNSENVKKLLSLVFPE